MAYSTKGPSPAELFEEQIQETNPHREAAAPMPGTPAYQDLTSTQKADVLLAMDAAENAAREAAKTPRTSEGVTVTTSGKVEAQKPSGTSPGVTVKPSDERVTENYTYKVQPTMGPPIPADMVKQEKLSKDPIQNLIAYQQDPLARTAKNLGAKSEPTMSPAERTQASEQYKQTLKEAGISMIPIYGTKHYYDEASKDGMTPDEWGMLAASAVGDILTIIPAAGIVTGAARTAKGLGTAAKLSAIGSGVKQATIAEFTAPFTALQHPIETAKSAIRPIRSTVGSLKGVPTSALETRVTTVRAPLELFDNPEQAMALRDAAVSSRMTGGAGEATKAGKTMKVAGTAANAPGEAVAFHATPDVRPYANGAVIKEGREGGLFISPNLNTRFADASAFGDLPEGGIRGGLLIRDPEILAKSVPSGKVYAGTVEMERVLPAGTKLPAPSQYLFTYSTTTGDKLQIAVIGKPYTAAEIAKLKLYGSVDAIKNVLRDPVKVTGKSKLKVLKELQDEGAALRKEIAAGRKAGKETAQLERRLATTERQYARYAETLNRSRVPVSRLYVVTGKTALERFTEITRRADGRSPAVRGGVDRVRITIPDRAPTVEELRRATREAERANRPATVETPRRAAADDTRRTPADDDRRTPPADDRRTPPADDRRPPPADDRRTPPPDDRTPPPPPPPPPPRGGTGGAGRVLPKSKPLPKGVNVDIDMLKGGAVAWPQGFGWRVGYRNDAGKIVSKFYRGQKPPQGVKMVDPGEGEAYRGIQQYSGNKPIEGTLGMGAVSVTINKPQIRPGAKGTISFKASRITPKRPRIGR